MENILKDLVSLFEEAKNKSEFEFILVLINYRGMGSQKLTSNLYEWFDAIEFYKNLYKSHTGKEKTRIGTLLYSTFFENSDFYNIIGSLCRIKLGYKGSSYLFWKTKKYERLLGIGEKQDFLIELLNDASKQNIISFFEENHFKEIRNTFFHSAYALSKEDYILHDSDPIIINGIGHSTFNVKEFLYPKIDNIIAFFDTFKKVFLESLDSYKADKEVTGFFPNLQRITILGSEKGLQGFKIKNSVQFYGQWHDSGIWYDDQDDMWIGCNIMFNLKNKETIEIREQLSRFENKDDITKNNTEFFNLIDKISERKQQNEINRAVTLLIKFGDIRYQKMLDEENIHKKQSFPKIILPYYKQAIQLNSQIDLTEIHKRIKELE